MSSEIQRKNHRIHPCNSDKKIELLNFLIAQHPEKNILIISTNPLKEMKVSKNVTFITDQEMQKSEKNSYEILISYDLPEKAIIYMSRFAHAKEMALILLGSEDQKHLYAIETLLGRTIIQEAIAGYEPSFGIAVDNQHKAEAKARRAAREEEEALKAAKWAKKEKEKPKFLGKDANGKPIFEKKSRERNHYIDGTPRKDEEKFTQTPFKSKPVFFNEKGNSATKDASRGENKKPYKPKPEGEKKEFGEKKPYDAKKSFGEKKSYGEKKPYGERKPYGEKKPYDAKKSFDNKPAAKVDTTPARPPRRINVKSLKPADDKQ